MAEVLAPPPALIRKLEEIDQRYQEMESQLNDPAIANNGQKIVSISREKGAMSPIVMRYRDYREASKQVGELREMSGNRSDPDMAELASSELPELRTPKPPRCLSAEG